MNLAPRLEVDLLKIHHNASRLVEHFSSCGISITGICKATQGSSEVANTMLRAGVQFLGDSRIENIETMRKNGVKAHMTLIRSPMLSQVPRVIASADVSFNTELTVIEALSQEAHHTGRTHGVILMVELGDRREGIMPNDLLHSAQQTLSMQAIELKGIGTNLACLNGVAPDANNMAELSSLVHLIESTFQIHLELISGGNSANMDWALGSNPLGRINNLRFGEAILLGCETMHRQPIKGLFDDAFTLVAEVIESKLKPTQPHGTLTQAAFASASPAQDRGLVMQSIVAIGRQDTDPDGLRAPHGIEIIGASSDHLILISDHDNLSVGQEVAFQLNYSALLMSMQSNYVSKVYL